MSRTSDFSIVKSVAKIHWTLKTETPLSIKSGTTSGYDKDKVIFSNKSIDTATEGSVADFYFTVYFETSKPDKPVAVFRIPASSIRGALRNYTIKRLVNKAFWRATLFPDKNSAETTPEIIAEYEQDLKNALKDPGWHLIQNLFGLAADTGNKDLQAEGVAGRLQVTCDDNVWPIEKINDKTSPLAVVTRNPLDRVSRGTKGGGLHSFMELKPEFEFNVSFRIINPNPEDLGFIAFWEKSINHGLIRLGGLAGVGKGRLKVQNTQAFLFARSTLGFDPMNSSSWIHPEETRRDILGEIFPTQKLNWDEKQKSNYLKKLNAKFKNVTGRGENGLKK